MICASAKPGECERHVMCLKSVEQFIDTSPVNHYGERVAASAIYYSVFVLSDDNTCPRGKPKGEHK